jgi:hypothetical protein
MATSELSLSLSLLFSLSSLLNVIHIAEPQTCIDLLSVMQNGYIEFCALLAFYEE